jgi:hypothetical protein
MTVCIAGFAFSRKGIIAVSDRRLTYGDIAADVATVEKAVRIHPCWMAMFAGNDIGNVTPILDRVRTQLPQDKPVSRIDVAREIRGAFRAQHRTIIEERVLAPFDLSVRDFQQKGFSELGPQTFNELRHEVQATKVDCEFLICGFSETEPQIFAISDHGLSYYDKIGYWSIGSGAWSALSSLAFRKFHLDLSIHEAMYQLLEAKFMADTAVPTVGKETYALLMKANGAMAFMDESGIGQVRAIWEAEGQPRTPPDLESRMPHITAMPIEGLDARRKQSNRSDPQGSKRGR